MTSGWLVWQLILGCLVGISKQSETNSFWWLTAFGFIAQRNTESFCGIFDKSTRLHDQRGQSFQQKLVAWVPKVNGLLGGLIADERWDDSKLAWLPMGNESLCGMMANKTSGLMAEEIIFCSIFSRLMNFTEVWMNSIHPVCPLASSYKLSDL